MRSGVFTLTVILVISFLQSFSGTMAADARASESQRSTILVDLANERTFGLIQANDGVSVHIVKDSLTKQRVVEIRVQPFSIHQNPWPSISCGPEALGTPLNLTPFTSASINIQNCAEGTLPSVGVYYSTLPHNDGGRNLDGDQFVIPGGTSMICPVPSASLERNDPSSINFLMLAFPAAETEQVYHISEIAGVYDPASGSPVDSATKTVAGLREQFPGMQKRVNWDAVSPDSQKEWRKRTAAIGASIDDLVSLCASAKARGFEEGTYKPLSGKLAEVSQEMGQLLLADQKDFAVWDIDPYLNIFRTDSPGFGSSLIEKASVMMALGEFRDLVFMVSPCDRDIRLAVELKLPAGLPKNCAIVQETVYLKNRRNEETGDTVRELSKPLAIPKGESRQIRVRFDTRSSGIQPSAYAFEIVLRDADTGTSRNVSGTLEIWDFKLPNYDVLANNSYALFDTSMFTNGLLLSKAVEHMKMYGLNFVYVHQNEIPKPADVDADGNIIAFDDSAFEKRIGPIVQAWNAAPGDESLRFLFSLSGTYELCIQRSDIHFGNEKWKHVLAQWLDHLEQLVHRLGVPDNNWMLVLADEASEAALLRDEIPMAEAIKAINPRIKLTCNTSTVISDPTQRERMKVFDILQPNLVELKHNRYLQDWIRQSGKETWAYQCVADMGTRVRNPYDYYRVQAWELLKYGLTGTGVWTYCAQAATQDGYGYLLVYPDGHDIMHSRRYEMFREGLDDYRYVCALRDIASQNGSQAQEQANALIAAAVADITSNPLDTSRCDHWRVKIANEILRLK